MKKLSALFFYLLLLSACSPASNENATEMPAEPSKSFASQVENEQQQQQLIKENKRCIRCHQVERKIKKIAAKPMLGKHADVDFFDNCSACHGIKDNHPKEDARIINLSLHSKTPLEIQNGQCLQCHNPKQLRQAEWTHDVHYQEINCASCHELHQTEDPIKSIPAKKRIQLCVDCHQKDKELL